MFSAGNDGQERRARAKPTSDGHEDGSGLYGLLQAKSINNVRHEKTRADIGEEKNINNGGRRMAKGAFVNVGCRRDGKTNPIRQQGQGRQVGQLNPTLLIDLRFGVVGEFDSTGAVGAIRILVVVVTIQVEETQRTAAASAAALI